MRLTKPLFAAALASLLKFASAADRTSVEEQAAISDIFDQCEPYNYPPLAGQSANFPPYWQTASIIPNDGDARDKYNEIQGSIPKIAPKGVISETLGSYDRANDPDCWWSATQCTVAKAPGVPSDLSMVPEPRTLGYGFDDGPNCSHNAFYDYLTSQDQKATMFFIGSNVMIWPLQAKRALKDGHEICVHTWSHQTMTSLTNEQAFAEIYYTMQAIKLVTGVTPTCFRPPFGDTDDRIRYIAHALDLRSILWKHDTRDTIPDRVTRVVEVSAVEKNYEDFIQLAQSGAFETEGAILLAHETNNMTMSEAIKYYPQLKAAFNGRVVPVGVALNMTQPYVESDYSLPTFEQYIGGTTETEGPPQNPSTDTNPSSPSSPNSAKPGTGTAPGKPNTTHSNSTAVKPSSGAVPVYPGAAMLVLLPLAVVASL